MSLYVDHLHEHLLSRKPIEKVIVESWVAHRSKRFYLLYVLQDRKTFYRHYNKRHALGTTFFFDQLINSLYAGGRQKEVKEEFIQTLEIKRSMATNQKIPHHLILEINKDLASFEWYVKKKKRKILQRDKVIKYE